MTVPSVPDLPEIDDDVAAASVDLDHLPSLIGYTLRRAQLAVFHDFNRSFAEVDIRPAQYGVLVLIERNPGLKQSALGAALGIKRSNLVVLIDGLEQRGLARRTTAAGDRRSHALYLTDAGAALVRKLRVINAAHEQRLVELIGADRRERLIEMLHALASLGRR